MRRVVLVLAAALLSVAPLHAEQKNVKVLTGLSDFELLRAMQLMRASLGVGCDYCHAAAADGKELDFASDAKKEKETARKMIAMVKSINADNFGGRPAVSCNSCHRGATEPVGIIPLPQPLPSHKAEGETAESRPQPMTRDEVVAKYAAAIGKPAAALWSSRHLVGTRTGPDGKAIPLVVDETPSMSHVTVTMGENAKMEQAATATAGWSRNAKGTRPFGAYELTLFHNLENAFAPPLPDSIPADARAFRRTIDGHDTVIVFFRPTQTTRERLEFDPASGLLTKRMTYVETPVGIAPTETDFEDWRDVNGMKYPFTIKVSPYDPRVGSTRHYTEVVLGAKVDERLADTPK